MCTVNVSKFFFFFSPYGIYLGVRLLGYKLYICTVLQDNVYKKSKKGWWIAAHFRSEVALAHTLWLCIISRIFVALDLGVRVRAWEQPLGSPGLVQLKGCQSLSLGRGWGWELHPPFAEQASGSQTSNRRPEPRPSKLCQAKRTFCLTHPGNWFMGHKGGEGRHIF